MLKALAQPTSSRADSVARDLNVPGRYPRTQDQIVAAALRTLIAHGLAGATARAIARSGNFNQALIFYHFGTVRDLLLVALDHSSERRLLSYKQTLADVGSIRELVPSLRRLYDEDVRSGHVRIVQELAAGASSDPNLGDALRLRMEPWLELVGAVASRFLHETILEGVVSIPDLSFATIAAYLGVETISGMGGLPKAGSGVAPVDSLFELAERLSPLIEGLLGKESRP